MFELDGLVMADQCMLVIEAKTKIFMRTIEQMEETLQSIESLRQKEGSSTEIGSLFYNKELKLTIAGQVVDRPAVPLLHDRQRSGWQVWLPGASGTNLADACFDAHSTAPPTSNAATTEPTEPRHVDTAAGFGRSSGSSPAAAAPWCIPPLVPCQPTPRLLGRVQHLRLLRPSGGGCVGRVFKAGWR